LAEEEEEAQGVVECEPLLVVLRINPWDNDDGALCGCEELADGDALFASARLPPAPADATHPGTATATVLTEAAIISEVL